MRLRFLMPPMLAVVCACETSVEPDIIPVIDPPRASRLSSDWVKTILREDGTLLTWGPGADGTLGLGDLAWHDTPQLIPSLDHVVSYVQGGGTAFALTHYGDLYFWGNNHFFLEEPGLDTIVVSPFRVSWLEGAVSLDYSVTNWIHFITQDGSLGRVTHDPDTPTAYLLPEEIVLPNRVVQVSATLGLYSDGTLFSLYDTEPSYGGIVPGLDSVAAVQNIFSRRTVYLSLDGTVWAWGQNGCGELGNGTYESSATPSRVSHLSDIVQISAKYDFNLALRNDGTVWFWGFRGKDENGAFVCQNVPVMVAGIGNGVDIHAAFESLIQTETGKYFLFRADDYSLHPVPLP